MDKWDICTLLILYWCVIVWSKWNKALLLVNCSPPEKSSLSQMCTMFVSRRHYKQNTDWNESGCVVHSSEITFFSQPFKNQKLPNLPCSFLLSAFKSLLWLFLFQILFLSEIFMVTHLDFACISHTHASKVKAQEAHTRVFTVQFILIHCNLATKLLNIFLMNSE